MPGFKPGVFVYGESQAVFNGLCFATRDEAERYARDLAGRWTLVERTVVEESNDPVNYRWDSETGLVAVPTATVE